MDENLLYNLSYPWLDASDTHDAACCLCAGRFEQSTKIKFELNGKIFEIRHCREDDLMYLWPQPGKKYSEELYNHPTYFRGLDDMYGLDLNEEKSKAVAKIRIGEIREYAPKARSLLEIGPAFGHLLIEAENDGFKIARGVEFSKTAVEIGRSKDLDIVYSDANKPLDSVVADDYDVIAAYSVFEHLENPAEFLGSVKKFLKPGGVLIIRVPDTDPEDGPKISLLDHLWHFTRGSMAKLLESRGFKIVDIFESGVFYGIQHKITMKNMTFIVSL